MLIYHYYCETNETEGMFDGTGRLLGSWYLNDAQWRGEYMKGFLQQLGIRVESPPEGIEQKCHNALVDRYGE